MEECYLRSNLEYFRKGRNINLTAGKKFFYEVEILSSEDDGEVRHYYVYEKPNVHFDFLDEDEFNEMFMTKDEVRDRKIDDII